MYVKYPTGILCKLDTCRGCKKPEADHPVFSALESQASELASALQLTQEREQYGPAQETAKADSADMPAATGHFNDSLAAAMNCGRDWTV